MVRTRKQIDAAFVELLHRRPYGSIRVSDIARKAGVGRATFYAHYSSKDELLRSQFSRIVIPMLATKLEGACPLNASAFFAHVRTAPQIYKALMSSPDAGRGPIILRECFEEHVRKALRSPESNSSGSGEKFDVQKTVTARFVASSLFAVVECSLESSGRQSPQELQDIFQRLVGGGLSGLGSSR